jgi:hypothetical protein
MHALAPRYSGRVGSVCKSLPRCVQGDKAKGAAKDAKGTAKDATK